MEPIQSADRRVDFVANIVEKDDEAGIFYLQQDSLGVAVYPETITKDFEKGQVVQVEGIVEPSINGPIIVDAKFTETDLRVRFSPLRVTTVEDGKSYLNKLIVVEGIVRSSGLQLGKYYEIELGSGKGVITAHVYDTGSADFDLRNSYIELLGIVTSEKVSEDGFKSLSLLARGEDSFVVLDRPIKPSKETTIVDYLDEPEIRLADQKVQIKARLKAKDSGSFTLSDETGDLEVNGILSDAIDIGTQVKLEGFPPRENSSQTWSSLLIQARSGSTLKRDQLNGLNSIRSIKRLSNLEASASLPVKIRGRVTFSNNSYFGTVQDNSAGIFVVFPEPTILTSGELIELEGETQRGSFAPIIRVRSLKRLGLGELPDPPEPSISELQAGLYDSEWLKTKGLVVATESDDVLGDYLLLRNGLEDIKVSVPLSESAAEKLIGSMVEVRGISLTVFDTAMRILGFQISTPSEKEIDILSPAAAEPDQKEITPIRNLLRFENIENSLARVRIEGVVTSLHSSGGFFIQDEEGAALILAGDTMEVRQGETIQATGFASSSGSLTTLMATKISTEGETPFPEVFEVSMLDGAEMCYNHDGQMVEIQGSLDRILDYGANPSIQISANNYSVSAFLSEGVSTDNLEPGSRLRLQGVCETLLETHSFVPKPFGSALYISSNDGIEVLSRPKTNFLQVYQKFFSFLVAMLLLGLGWIAILRRQVHNQTEIIRKRLEIEERLKKEALLANRTKSEFLANMSHEIRTPLTSILGFAEIIAELEDSKSQDLAELIGVSGQRLMRTINSVLDLASLDGRGPNLILEPLDLLERAKEAMTALRYEAERKGLSFTLNCEYDSVMVIADESAIQRVLTNLLANAIKFTEDGKVEVLIVVKEGVVVMDVTDTGIGIKEEFQDLIFEAFSQESMGESRLYEGNGLGLTIVKKLVNYMNGTIVLFSKANVGSTFQVTLPLYTTDSKEKSTKAERKLASDNIDQVLKGLK